MYQPMRVVLSESFRRECLAAFRFRLYNLRIIQGDRSFFSLSYNILLLITGRERKKNLTNLSHFLSNDKVRKKPQDSVRFVPQGHVANRNFTTRTRHFARVLVERTCVLKVSLVPSHLRVSCARETVIYVFLSSMVIHFLKIYRRCLCTLAPNATHPRTSVGLGKLREQE